MASSSSRLCVIAYIVLATTACSPIKPDATKNTSSPPLGLFAIATSSLSATTPMSIVDTSRPTWIRDQISYLKLNLVWQECQIHRIASYYDDWASAGQCLGAEPPQRQGPEEEKERFGESYSSSPDGLPMNLRLGIGEDIYEASIVDSGNGYENWTLRKNGEVVVEEKGHFAPYNINQSLLNVNGKIAWEFADVDHPTIIYDGIDLQNKYELEAAYIPNVINNKLIFVAKKEDRYFVIYDGQKLGPEFDSIEVGYCCDETGYSIRRPFNQYWFWGSRGGRSYIVSIVGK